MVQNLGSAGQNYEFVKPVIKPYDDTKFGKNLVYTRRGEAIHDLLLFKISTLYHLHEINVFDIINLNSTNCDDLTSNELLSVEPIAHVDHNLDLPIALLSHLTL